MKKLCYLLIPCLFIVSCKKDKVVIEQVEQITINKDSINNVINDSIVLKLPENIQNLYKKFDNKIIWSSSKNRKDLLESISKCTEDGLFVENYELEKLKSFEKNRNQLNYFDFEKYDIFLSKAFNNLSNHLKRGIVNPKELYSDWDVPFRNAIEFSQLANAIANEKIKSFLKDHTAQNSSYSILKENLKKYKEFPNEAFSLIPKTSKIVVNDTHTSIPLIKRKLQYFGYLTENDETTLYDNSTFNAIIKFQENQGLSADGVIGNGTFNALNISKESLLKKIRIAMERAKWYPDNISNTCLFVNIPDFKVHFIFEGDTIDTKRTVVGTVKRKTPVLSSRISDLIFNPTWTLPPTIVKEDMTPKAKKNRGYFAASRITIKDNKGNIVDPENWNPENYNAYRYVQSSGIDNALGLVKFNFANKYSVFLHDTNHRDYFDRSNRALSSGCVRIEDPLAFSKSVLMKENEEKWKDFEIDSIIKRAEKKTISLTKTIKIYLFYTTFWIQNNVFHTRKDVYNYDDALYQKLRSQSIFN
jgi:L,D-transpeptidase YcbB